MNKGVGWGGVGGIRESGVREKIRGAGGGVESFYKRC